MENALRLIYLILIAFGVLLLTYGIWTIFSSERTFRVITARIFLNHRRFGIGFLLLAIGWGGIYNLYYLLAFRAGSMYDPSVVPLALVGTCVALAGMIIIMSILLPSRKALFSLLRNRDGAQKNDVDSRSDNTSGMGALALPLALAIPTGGFYLVIQIELMIVFIAFMVLAYIFTASSRARKATAKLFLRRRGVRNSILLIHIGLVCFFITLFIDPEMGVNGRAGLFISYLPMTAGLISLARVVSR